MEQFTVPQFIDVEDKIFGPITTRQFIVLLVAALCIFISFKLADTTLFIFLTAIIGGLALTIAFVKINGQTFHYFILNIFQTVRRPSRRIWYKTHTPVELKELMKSHELMPVEAATAAKHVTRSRIRDLSLQVNTGGYYKSEE